MTLRPMARLGFGVVLANLAVVGVFILLISREKVRGPLPITKWAVSIQAL